jgi:hypothetical protein
VEPVVAGTVAAARGQVWTVAPRARAAAGRARAAAATEAAARAAAARVAAALA